MTVTHPFAEGYGLRVDSQYLRLAPDREHELRYYFQDSLALRQDNQGSTLEHILEVGYPAGWTDFSGGEGYDWDPPAIPSQVQGRNVETSFWDSMNFNVARPEPGQPYLLQLAKEGIAFGASLTAPVAMATSTDYVYITDGQDVKRYPDWSTTTPQTTYTDPTTDLVAIAAAPNNAVMVVDDAGDVWYKSSAGTTFSRIYDSTAHGDIAAGVWYIKARWIVFTWEGGQGQLAEMPVTGGAIASNVFDTMAAEVWSMVSSGPAVVAAVSDGTIRTYTADNATASSGQTLVSKDRFQLPYGEVPYLVGDNAGTLGILTAAQESGVSTFTVRMYQAQVLDARYDYSVGQVQLRREWGGATVTYSVTARMAATRDELLWTVKESDGDEYLWRFDIVTGGLSRLSDLGSTSMTFQIGTFDGRWAAIQGTNVLIKSDLYQSTGYLITPNITFGLNTDIAWMSHVFASEFQVGSGAVVELYYSTDPAAITDRDHASWVRIRRIHAAQSGSTYGEQVFPSLRSRTLTLKIEGYASADQTSTPKVSRTAVRGLPTHRDFVVEAPINVSDYVEVPMRRPLRVPGKGETTHQMLLGLVGTNVDIEVYRPNVQFRGIVHKLMEPVSYMTHRGSPSRMAMVQFLGSLIVGGSSTYNAPTGNEGLGIGLLGVARIGIGDSGVQ